MKTKTLKPIVLMHCQYVYGIGHFVRSITLAKALSEYFQVYLLNGGEPIDNFKCPSEIEIIQLPAIYKNEQEDFLRPVDANKSLDDCFQEREQIILKVIQAIKPTIFVSEHFPFGLLFKKEVIFTILALKEQKPDTRIICSVRDIIQSPDGVKTDQETSALLNAYYDLLLIHGDEHFIPLSMSFPLYQNITIPAIHTGYICRLRSTLLKKRHKEKPLILASIAAGRLGGELLKALKEVAPLIKNEIDCNMVLFSGAFAQDIGNQTADTKEMDNILVLPFDSDSYLEYLSNADLVISLGGYNSLIESIAASKNLLIYNRHFAGDNREQDLRINKFHQAGLLNVIAPSSLDAQRLSQIILDNIEKTSPGSKLLNTNGAVNTTKILIEFLKAS